MRFYLLIIIGLLIFTFSSCTDEPPVLPGLTKSTFIINTDPTGAIIKINNRDIEGVTPIIMDNLEPGFYKFELSKSTYLDTTLYYVLERNVKHNMQIELRENPAFWWKLFNTKLGNIPTNFLRCIKEDINGNIWVGTSGSGLMKILDTSFTLFNSTNSGLLASTIYDITFDRYNNLWMATDNGIVKFNGTNSFVHFNASNSEIKDNYITSICADKNDNIWFGTQNGLYKYNKTKFTYYNEYNSGLSSSSITKIFVDSKNVKWIGTNGEGLCKFDELNWQSYNSYKNDLQGSIISSILEKDGVIWIATGNGNSGGISYLENGKFVFPNFNLSLPSPRIFQIVYDAGGNLWAATIKGLVKFSTDGKIRVYNSSNSGLSMDAVTGVLPKSPGYKYILNEGLAIYLNKD